MKPSSLLAALAAVVLSGTTFAAAQGTPNKPAPNLAEVSRAVADIRQSVAESAKEEETRTGKAVARTEMMARIAERMRPILAAIDVNAIPESQSSEWAQLFTQAGMATEAKRLQLSALTYHNVQLMFTSVDLIPKLMANREYEQAFTVIKHVPDIDASMVGMIGESVNNAIRANGLDKTQPEYALRCLKALRDRVDLAPSPLGGRGNAMAEYVYVDLSMKMLELRYEKSPNPAILAEMRALKKRFSASKSTNAFGQNPVHRIDEFFLRASSIGKPAPELVADRTLGDFRGLSALRGKVVILDFMAHWCGPCKVALPELKALQTELGPAGLQVVSVTSFYGYIGAQQGLKPDREFEAMKGFNKSYGITWPMVFDTAQVSHSKYNVGAIPHMVVIDRKGNIRRVQVGSAPEEAAKTAAIVRDLLKESS